MPDITKDTDTAPDLESFNEPEPGDKAKTTDTPTADHKPTADADPKPAADADKDIKKDTTPAADDKTKEPAADEYAFLDSMEAEGIKQDPEAVKAFKELAKTHKLTPDAAKAVAQFQLDAAKKQADAFKDLQKSWEEQAKTAYGENLKNVETNCSRVLAELDKEGKFKELLALVGAEKHPATLGFLKAVGEKMLEKPAVNPNATVSGEEDEPELEDFN